MCSPPSVCGSSSGIRERHAPGTSSPSLPSPLRDRGGMLFTPPLRAQLVPHLVHALDLIQRYLFQKFASRAPAPQFSDPCRDAGFVVWWIGHTGHIVLVMA